MAYNTRQFIIFMLKYIFYCSIFILECTLGIQILQAFLTKSPILHSCLEDNASVE